MTRVQSNNPVADLLNRGFCSWPVDAAIIGDAAGAYPLLIEKCRTSQDSWTYVRPGEEPLGPEDTEVGPDVGLIDLTQNRESGKDIKWYFHYTPDLLKLACEHDPTITPQMREAIGIMSLAYAHINERMFLFATQLEEAVPEFFLKPGLAKRLVATTTNCQPFATTTLRGLWYPDVPEQKGAKLHIDRSTLTGHCGDRNGQLYALVGPNQERVSISPPQGQMAVFPGVRILFETNGRIRPLSHGSTSVPGTDRMAMVQFCHTDVGYQVRSNKAAKADFWEKFYQPEA